jgi:hypothetical protein
MRELKSEQSRTISSKGDRRWHSSTLKPNRAHYRYWLRGWLEEVQRIGELLNVNGPHCDVDSITSPGLMAGLQG